MGKIWALIVDEASQVVKIEDENIEVAPDIIKGNERAYIHGVGKMGDDIVILLDLEKVLSDEEKQEVMGMDS